MRVLVTRAEPAASRTAEKLRKIGHEPILLPMFELVDTGQPVPDHGEESVIFTSANAIEIMSQRGWNPPSSLQTAWCVGEQTAILAKSLGFTTIKYAAGGGKVLAEKILQEDVKESGGYLYLTTPDRSFDLSGILEEHGVKVRQVEVYQTRKLYPDPEEILRAIKQCADGVSLIFSARSARHFLDCIKSSQQETPTKRIGIIGISDTVTPIFEPNQWAKVLSADSPSEKSMFEKLDGIRLA